MHPSLWLINDLLVDTFNLVLKTEESALADTRLADITITDVHIIDAIGALKKCTMGELATRVCVTMATLTPAIDRLTKKGYVVRVRDEADRRKVLVSLERKGEMVNRMHRLFHLRMMDEALSGMSPGEHEALAHALTNLKAFFSKNT